MPNNSTTIITLASSLDGLNSLDEVGGEGLLLEATTISNFSDALFASLNNLSTSSAPASAASASPMRPPSLSAVDNINLISEFGIVDFISQVTQTPTLHFENSTEALNIFHIAETDSRYYILEFPCYTDKFCSNKYAHGQSQDKCTVTFFD